MPQPIREKRLNALRATEGHVLQITNEIEHLQVLHARQGTDRSFAESITRLEMKRETHRIVIKNLRAKLGFGA